MTINMRPCGKKSKPFFNTGIINPDRYRYIFFKTINLVTAHYSDLTLNWYNDFMYMWRTWIHQSAWPLSYYYEWYCEDKLSVFITFVFLHVLIRLNNWEDLIKFSERDSICTKIEIFEVKGKRLRIFMYA